MKPITVKVVETVACAAVAGVVTKASYPVIRRSLDKIHAPKFGKKKEEKKGNPVPNPIIEFDA